jgi:ribonuclease P protein component
VDTITSASEIDALFKQGRRAGTELLVALALPTPDRRGPEGRVVFVAGKKLGGAVLRNRCKRVARESVRRMAGPWPGFDVAIVARGGIATAAPGEIDAALQSALRRLKVAQ